MITKIVDGFVHETLSDGGKHIDRIENISTRVLTTEKNRLHAVLHPPCDIGELSLEETENIHDLLEAINHEISIRNSVTVAQ